jgi:hypothetical protein
VRRDVRVGLKVQDPKNSGVHGFVQAMHEKKARVKFTEEAAEEGGPPASPDPVLLNARDLVLVPFYTYDIEYSRSKTTGTGIAEGAIKKNEASQSRCDASSGRAKRKQRAKNEKHERVEWGER